MDVLRQDDVQLTRNLSLEQRATIAIAAVETGIRLKRAALRQRLPTASDSEIEHRLREWLLSDE